jgi:hypothetical protein
MNRHHRLASLAGTTLPVAALEQLLLRALCRGDSDDAERASIELYLCLLPEMERGLPGEEENAPCLVATLMFAMARRFLAGPQGTPPVASHAVRRPSEPLHLAA